jgi:hypothetical protein
MFRYVGLPLRFFPKPHGEIGDGLRVHLGVIPLLQNTKIRRAFRPGLIARPPIAFEIVCRRGQRVEGTVN